MTTQATTTSRVNWDNVPCLWIPTCIMSFQGIPQIPRVPSMCPWEVLTLKFLNIDIDYQCISCQPIRIRKLQMTKFYHKTHWGYIFQHAYPHKLFCAKTIVFKACKYHIGKFSQWESPHVGMSQWAAEQWYQQWISTAPCWLTTFTGVYIPNKVLHTVVLGHDEIDQTWGNMLRKPAALAWSTARCNAGPCIATVICWFCKSFT